MLSLAEIAKEVHLRIDQEEAAGIPTLTKSGMFEIVKSVFDVISMAAVTGEGTSVPKFGKFIVEVKAARTARNPKTGEPVEIPEKLAIKFRPSSTLRLALAEADLPDAPAPKPKAKAKKKGGKKKKK